MKVAHSIAEMTYPAAFAAGKHYRAAAGHPDRLQDEVDAITCALKQALIMPVSLQLRPYSDTQSPSVTLGWEYQATEPEVIRSRVGLYTSGTTGAPKLRWHDLRDTVDQKRGGSTAERWLLTFAPFRWAGLSVILHALRFGTALAVPSRLEAGPIVEAGIEQGATHVSLTPSLFRRLQLTAGPEVLSRLTLKQITFGGEAATQEVLDTAKRLWPNAKVTHIYASSEFGDILAVSDGLAGVPAYKFERPGFDVASDGQLWIHREPSGDLWKLVDGRYFFLGRVQEMVNVGGHKVSPIEVESVAMQIPGVLHVRAYGISNPLLGQVVALDYVGEIGPDRVRQALIGTLPKVACPARVQHVDSISLTDAYKIARTIL
jgi:acyl-coenzyme A synthetase/AMP-(fatty) acid ligase